MRTYIPMVEIEARDPMWAARIRARERVKGRRLREANPELDREKDRKKYANNPEQYRAAKKTWRAENPEKVREIKDRYRHSKRARYLVSHIKVEARKKGVDFDLTEEWFASRLEAGVCEMSGLSFDMEGKRTPDSPSVDRRIPGGHYTQENCRLILWSLNRALFNYGEEYVLNIFQHVLAKRAG